MMTGNQIAKVAQMPPMNGLDPKLLTPQDLEGHRQMICLEVEVVLSGYFQSDRGSQMNAAVRAWWADELECWKPDQVKWALRQWNRDNPDRRPNPGHILQVLKKAWGKKNEEQIREAMRLSAPVEPERPKLTGKQCEERAAVLQDTVRALTGRAQGGQGVNVDADRPDGAA